MLTTGIVILVVAGIILYFYSKCSVATALSTTLAALFSTIIAFTYYEKLALLFMDKRIGLTWIQGVVFLVLFLLPFLLLRVLSDFLVNSKMDLGKPVKVVSSILFGFFCGILVSGNILLAMGMLPGTNKMLYFRYPPNQPIRLNQPATPLLNPDGLTASLYSWISRGSLSGKKSFSVLHADFVNQNHLNRYGLNDSIQAVCSPETLKLPDRKTKPVRIFNLSGEPYVVVRVGISTASIKDGGAKSDDGEISFIPAQFRVIYKQNEQASDLSGMGIQVYPKGILIDGELNQLELSQKIPIEKEATGRKRIGWIDLAFSIPSGHTPVLLAFKQNALIDLPKPVPTTEEIEQALEADAMGKPSAQK